MGDAFFVQLALSAGAVGVLVAIAAWAKIARPVGPLDEHKARVLLAEEFPTRTVDAVWIASDGCGALAKSGGLALVICRVGDGFAARQIPWPQAVSATFKNGRLSIDLSDIAAPRAVIALPAWPPKSFNGDLAA
jgi:threonine dehydrogenase-like Zn-dependent dehydrogenase